MDPNVKYLTDEEIKQFMKELDGDNDGLIAYDEVEAKLDKVSREIGNDQAARTYRTMTDNVIQHLNQQNITSTMKTAQTNDINSSGVSWERTKITSTSSTSRK
jgi:ribosomal protein S13